MLATGRDAQERNAQSQHKHPSDHDEVPGEVKAGGGQLATGRETLQHKT